MFVSEGHAMWADKTGHHVGPALQGQVSACSAGANPKARSGHCRVSVVWP